MVCSSLGGRARWLCCAAALVFATGCESPLVGQGGVEAGGVEFKVGQYELRQLELLEGNKTIVYPTPVLVVPITLTNKGEGDWTYTPTHNAPQMGELATPLLYKDPGAEAKLPPESKATVPSVILAEGALEGQVTAPRIIKPGESVEDKLLFQIPSADFGDKFILSIPPVWHRGKVPALIRMGYAGGEVVGPVASKMGVDVDFEGIKFKVTGVSAEYIKIKSPEQGEGYSKEIVLKVSYEVSNGSGASFLYEPRHRTGPGGRLAGKDGTVYSRVRFDQSIEVIGQQAGKREISPGDKAVDFALFNLPEDAAKLVFEMPATTFDRSGVARIQLSYDGKKPEQPEEMKKK